MTAPILQSGNDLGRASGARLKQNALRYAAMNVAEAAAWFLYVWILTRLLPTSDLGRVIYALVFSGCVGAVLTVGWKAWLLEQASRPGADMATAWSVAAAGLATRCMVVLPIMVMVSWNIGGMVLSPMPEMPILIASLAGLFALSRLVSFGLRARGETTGAALLHGPLPILLAVGAVLVMAETRAIPFDLLLALHAVCLVVPIVLGLLRLPRLRWNGDLPSASVFAPSMTQSGALLYRNADVLVVGLVLTPLECAIYLIVRGVAMVLDLVFRVLGHAMSEPMSHSMQGRSGGLFVSQAARANLGFLLIGGAGAILLFITADPVLGVFGIFGVEGRQALVWLIIAQTAPAIFGATHVFMSLTKLDGLRAWVVWPALPLALMFVFAGAREGLVQLAMTYAVLQIGLAAVCAVIVALRCGIWPGLTAMFHGRIRLR